MFKKFMILIIIIPITILSACSKKEYNTKKHVENSNIGKSEEIQNEIDYEDPNNWVILDDLYVGVYQDIIDDLPIPDMYKNKSRKEWEDYSISIGKIDNEFIQWGVNGLLSPNGELAVYNSNKNTLEDGGMSIFLLDMKTGEEKVLVQSTEGGYIANLWWIDNSRIVYSYYKDETNIITISNIEGKIFPINSAATEMNIIAFKDNHLLYEAKVGVENEVKIAYIDQYNALKEIDTLTLEVGFFNGSGAISPDLTKAMLLVRDSYESANRSIMVWDFINNKTSKMPDPIVEKGVIDAISIFWDEENPTVDFLITKGEDTHNELWEYKYNKDR